MSLYVLPALGWPDAARLPMGFPKPSLVLQMLGVNQPVLPPTTAVEIMLVPAWLDSGKLIRIRPQQSAEATDTRWRIFIGE